MTEPTPYTPTHPTQVTLYEDRAEVVRDAEITLGVGQHMIVLEGMTALLDDNSLQITPRGDGIEVLSTKVRREVIAGADLNTNALHETEEALAEHALRNAQAQRTMSRLTQERKALERTLLEWAKALACVPEETAKQREGWQDAYTENMRLLHEVMEQISAHQSLCDTLDDERKQLNERKQTLHNASPKLRALCEVQLRTTTPDTFTVQIQYRTPCALWRPEHHAALQTDPENPQNGTLTLLTYGVIWQSTGERWEDVQIRLSTARPSSLSRAPLVSEDTLWKRSKTSYERKMTHVTSYEEEISDTPEERGQSSQFPGVDDGGEPLWFSPEGTHTLTSNGLPNRVVLHKRALEARIDRIVYPERTHSAYRRVHSSLIGLPVPLLAGPVLLKRDQSIVGRSVLEYVAAGEPFTLGMGPDEVVRVRRDMIQKDERSAVLNTRTIQRKVSIWLSNLSDQNEHVTVKERVPVSEIEDLTIELTKSKHWDVDRDGFLTRHVTLRPHAHKELEIQYTIRASSNLALSL